MAREPTEASFELAASFLLELHLLFRWQMKLQYTQLRCWRANHQRVIQRSSCKCHTKSTLRIYSLLWRLSEVRDSHRAESLARVGCHGGDWVTGMRYVAANRKEASDKTAHFFRAKEVTRGRERESNMTAAPRLESHLKKGRCCLQEKEGLYLGQKMEEERLKLRGALVLALHLTWRLAEN